MDIRTIIHQFTQSVASLPAQEQAVLGDLAGRMASLSDQEIAVAVASGAGRGLCIRSGVRAGGPETDDRC